MQHLVAVLPIWGGRPMRVTSHLGVQGEQICLQSQTNASIRNFSYFSLKLQENSQNLPNGGPLSKQRCHVQIPHGRFTRGKHQLWAPSAYAVHREVTLSAYGHNTSLPSIPLAEDPSQRVTHPYPALPPRPDP